MYVCMNVCMYVSYVYIHYSASIYIYTYFTSLIYIYKLTKVACCVAVVAALSAYKGRRGSGARLRARTRHEQSGSRARASVGCWPPRTRFRQVTYTREARERDKGETKERQVTDKRDKRERQERGEREAREGEERLNQALTK